MDLNKAILYGQLVQAAYDVPTTDLNNRAGQTRDAGLGANKTTYEVIASIYANDLATDASKKRGATATVSIGLLLWQASSGEAVIAIRGTEGLLEWFQDAQFDTETCTFLAGAGQTEDGFTDMYNSFAVGTPSGPSVTASLATISGTRQVNSLTVCGHSLGGALATLQALDAAANSNFKNPTVYTYASPRTGDGQFVSTYDGMIPNTFRIANRVDLVPKLPLSPPYDHVHGLYGLTAIQFFPPAILVEPNPVCEHILETYLFLLSKLAGGEVLPPRPVCDTPGGLSKIIDHLAIEFRGVEQLTKDIRTGVGGVLGSRS
jgi:predicted lipase